MRRNPRDPGREDGYVMIAVIILLFVGLAVAGAALTESLASRSSSNRDLRAKRAAQAADAGIQATLYRANQANIAGLDLTGGTGVIGTALSCHVAKISASGQTTGFVDTAVGVSNACPANVGPTGSGPDKPEQVGNHGWFKAAYIPGESAPNNGNQLAFYPKIVSTGYDDNANVNDSQQRVVRRVMAVLEPIFPFATAEAQHDLTLMLPTVVPPLNLATTMTYNGTARAGHDLFFSGKGALTVASVLGGSLVGAAAVDVNCDIHAFPSFFAETVAGKQTPSGLPPQSGPCTSPVPFPRSAISLSTAKPDCQQSGATVSCGSVGLSPPAYNSATHTINVTAGATLTLAAGDYTFCNFNTNGPIQANATTSGAVRIFVRAPNDPSCPTGSSTPCPSGVATFTACGNFKATGGLTNALGAASPSQVQIYVVGNGTNNGTSVTASNPLATQFFLYAPTSNVSVSAGGAFTGSVVGYDVSIQALSVSQDPGVNNYPISNSAGVLRVKSYVECKPIWPIPADPAQGC